MQSFSGKSKENEQGARGKSLLTKVLLMLWFVFCCCPFKVLAIIVGKCKTVKTFDRHTLLSIEAKFDKNHHIEILSQWKKCFYLNATLPKRAKRMKMLNEHL